MKVTERHPFRRVFTILLTFIILATWYAFWPSTTEELKQTPIIDLETSAPTKKSRPDQQRTNNTKSVEISKNRISQSDRPITATRNQRTSHQESRPETKQYDHQTLRNKQNAKRIDRNTEQSDIHESGKQQTKNHCMLYGYITQDAKPLPGAAVTLFSRAEFGGFYLPVKGLATVSDLDGFYHLGSIASGEYRLTLSAPGATATGQALTCEADQPDIQINLEVENSQVRVSGRVVDSDDLPIARSTISVMEVAQPEKRNTVVVGNDGVFEFWLSGKAEKQYRIFAMATGYQAQMKTISGTESDLDLVFNLSLMSAVKGRVLGANGPVVGAMVHISDLSNDDFNFNSKSGPDGDFTVYWGHSAAKIEVEHGEYRGVVNIPERTEGQDTQGIEIRLDDRVDRPSIRNN